MKSAALCWAGRALPAAAILVIAFSACTRVSRDTAESHAGPGRRPWTRPGVFTFAENGNPKSLVTELDTNAVGGDLSMFIYSYAIRYNAKAQPVPDALTEVPTVANGDVSKDGLTLHYKLRHNVKWQDGQPLTCADLKFTWRVIMNSHNNVNTTDGFRDIGGIDCSDPYVAVIHMKRLYAPYLQQLWGVNGNAPILPEHILASYNDDKGSLNTAPFNSMPVGSGPFKVVEWKRGDEVRMVASPYFYLGKPKLDQVIFKSMPDENTMETQLRTHEIDMLARGTGLNWPQYQALAADPANGLTARRVNSFLYSHIDFNLRHPIVDDPHVRLALAYATDRDEIIDKIDHGSAVAAETDQSPVLSWAYTGNFAHHPFDPEKAKAILDADGWKSGPDGVRVKNGQRLEFNLSTQTESSNNRAIQTLVQKQWRDVGVQADVKNAPTTEFFDNSSAGVIQGGHYDVAIFSWVAAADPDDSPIYSGVNLAPGGQNGLFWNNPKVNAATRAALSTLDQNQRKAQYQIVQQQMALDVPTIVVYFLKEPFVYNTDLRGYDPSPVISSFWNPWEYSI